MASRTRAFETTSTLPEKVAVNSSWSLREYGPLTDVGWRMSRAWSPDAPHGRRPVLAIRRHLDTVFPPARISCDSDGASPATARYWRHNAWVSKAKMSRCCAQPCAKQDRNDGWETFAQGNGWREEGTVTFEALACLTACATDKPIVAPRHTTSIPSATAPGATAGEKVAIEVDGRVTLPRLACRSSRPQFTAMGTHSM